MKDVDDYRWISVNDRGVGETAFTCEANIALALSVHRADLVDDHSHWQWLSTIDGRSADRTGMPSLPVIQID